jgi:hypothetical protein
MPVHRNPGHSTDPVVDGKSKGLGDDVAEGRGEVAKDEHPATPGWEDGQGEVGDGREIGQHPREGSLPQVYRDPVAEVPGGPAEDPFPGVGRDTFNQLTDPPPEER